MQASPRINNMPEQAIFLGHQASNVQTDSSDDHQFSDQRFMFCSDISVMHSQNEESLLFTTTVVKKAFSLFSLQPLTDYTLSNGAASSLKYSIYLQQIDTIVCTIISTIKRTIDHLFIAFPSRIGLYVHVNVFLLACTVRGSVGE